jgi:hypothetical protein
MYRGYLSAPGGLRGGKRPSSPPTSRSHWGLRGRQGLLLGPVRGSRASLSAQRKPIGAQLDCPARKRLTVCHPLTVCHFSVVLRVSAHFSSHSCQDRPGNNLFGPCARSLHFAPSGPGTFARLAVLPSSLLTALPRLTLFAEGRSKPLRSWPLRPGQLDSLPI